MISNEKATILSVLGQAVRVACFEAVEQTPTSLRVSVLRIKKRLSRHPQIIDPPTRNVVSMLRQLGATVEPSTDVAVSPRIIARRQDVRGNVTLRHGYSARDLVVVRDAAFEKIISAEPLTVLLLRSEHNDAEYNVVQEDVVVPGVSTSVFAKRVIEDDNPPTPEPPRRTLFPKKITPTIDISKTVLVAALKIAARDRESHTWISLDRVRQVLLATYPSLASKTLGHDLRQRGCRLKLYQGHTVIVWDRTVDALLNIVR